MRFFSLRQTSQAVFLSMGLMTALGMSVSAQAATVNSAKAQATTTQKNNVARLTPANSTDGIIALVNENAILKSDLIAAIAQTQARAKAAGEPIANSAQLQSEVLNALILRELQLSLIKRVGLNPDEASINKRLEQIAKAEGLNSIAALQQRLDSAQSGSYATLRAQLIEDAAIQALQQRQITNRVRISEQDIDAFLASPEAKRLNQSEYQTVHVRVPYMDDYSRLSEAQRNDA
ncbi:peptidylprolyl isomerase, partial [Psychrobacter sp. 16-Bac2893]